MDSGLGFEVTAAETNNHVTITTDSWRRAIDLTIKVPRQFSLQLSTTQQGDIVVENVAGKFEISNVNGSIRLQQVAGSALLNSINGRLTASFTAVTPRAPMSFSTANGQIDLTLPVAVKATLKLKSDRGAVYSDFDLAVDPAAPTQVSPQRLSQDGWTVGRLNGGGAGYYGAVAGRHHFRAQGPLGRPKRRPSGPLHFGKPFLLRWPLVSYGFAMPNC